MSRSGKLKRTLIDGDSGFKQVQQEPVQGAEEGEEAEFDRVPLQLVHCPCHDHTWGQGFDTITGCFGVICQHSLKAIFLDKRSAISSIS